MIIKEGEILKIREQRFFRIGKEVYKKEFYDLNAFHIEQSIQLYFKYSLWKILGDFEKIHNIEKLLEYYAKASNQKEKIKKFIQKHDETINDLNIVYIERDIYPLNFPKNKSTKCFLLLKNY
jgi:HEPN domain-containing protein